MTDSARNHQAEFADARQKLIALERRAQLKNQLLIWTLMPVVGWFLAYRVFLATFRAR